VIKCLYANVPVVIHLLEINLIFVLNIPWFHFYIYLQFPKENVSFNLVNVFSPPPHFLSGQRLLVTCSLSKTFRAAYSSVYLMIPNKI